jgi:hypothetical protein
VRPDLVCVAAPDALARDVSRVDERGDDPLCRAFGDTDALRDVAQPDAGIPRSKD